MSAKVKPSVWGGWVGYCPECNESCAGSMAPVDMWAEVHNDDNHREESA